MGGSDVRLAAWQGNVWFENQLRQPDRSDGGARRVAAVTRRGQRLKIETCRLAFASRAQGACDLRGGRKYIHGASVSGAVHRTG